MGLGLSPTPHSRSCRKKLAQDELRAAHYTGRVYAGLSVPIRTGHWLVGWTLAPTAPVLTPLCKAGQLNPAWQLVWWHRRAFWGNSQKTGWHWITRAA